MHTSLHSYRPTSITIPHPGSGKNMRSGVLHTGRVDSSRPQGASHLQGSRKKLPDLKKFKIISFLPPSFSFLSFFSLLLFSVIGLKRCTDRITLSSLLSPPKAIHPRGEGRAETKRPPGDTLGSFGREINIASSNWFSRRGLIGGSHA